MECNKVILIPYLVSSGIVHPFAFMLFLCHFLIPRLIEMEIKHPHLFSCSPLPLGQGFPGSSAGKESACNAGDLGLIPGLGRSPGEGNSYLLQYFGLENSLDWIVHGSRRVGHNWVTFTFSFLLESGLGSSAAVGTAFVIISGVFLVMACCFSQCRFPGSLLLSNFPGFFLASVIRTLTHSLSLFPHYLLTFSQSLVKMHFFKDKLITRLLHCGWLTWYRIVYTDRT